MSVRPAGFGNFWVFKKTKGVVDFARLLADLHALEQLVQVVDSWNRPHLCRKPGDG